LSRANKKSSLKELKIDYLFLSLGKKKPLIQEAQK
jgi:hypothetical protein